MSDEIDPGRYAATKQTWRAGRRDVRDLFAEVVADLPDATKGELRKEFKHRATTSDEDLDACLDYAFDAAYLAIQRGPRTVGRRRRKVAEEAQEAEARKDDLKRRFKQQIQGMLLDLIMPNGKELRDCTGTYCAKLSGWLKELAKAGNRKIGQVYDETELRVVYKKYVR